MKEIILTRGLSALVDDEDYEYLNQWRWYALKNKNTFYASRSQTVDGKEQKIKMHRVIMNTPINLQIDHIDHNGLNNQKYNLRNVRLRDNVRNRQKSKNTKNRYKGVSIIQDKYIARIKYDGILHYLGTYKTEREAAIAYNEAALFHFGEFACINNINQ